MKKTYILILSALFLSSGLFSCEKKGEKDLGDPKSVEPVINLLLPNTGISGESIKITGKNFGDNAGDIKVNFNNESVEVQYVSSTELSIVAPNQEGKVNVTVLVKDKKSNAAVFTYKEQDRKGKITSTGHWIPENAEEIKGVSGMGPYIRLKNGSIFTVHENSAVSRVSPDEGKTWTTYPLFDAQQYVAWSPVYVEMENGVIILGFTNGKEKANWNWNNTKHDSPGAKLPTYIMRSLDGGKTWQNLQKLHDAWTGMNRDIKETKDGNVVFATMKLLHTPGRHAVLTYTTKDEGRTWIESNILDMGGSGDHAGTMESTFVQLNDGRLWMLLRTNWNYFYETYSSNEGITWSNPVPTDIDASSSPGALRRLASGNLILVWNRLYQEGKNSFPLVGGDGNLSEVPSNWQRRELAIILSKDDGQTWTEPVVISKIYGPEEPVIDPWNTKKWLSYPMLFEASPGQVWLSSGHGNLKMKFNESDYLK